MEQAASREQLAEALRAHSVHDPYVLLFGPDNPDRPGRYVLRVMLAVPGDRPLGQIWAAGSLERARDMMPAAMVRLPRVLTTPRPGLIEQWALPR